ncbi:MAG: histone deacetylase family protein [Desulfobacteraceae bacterium]|nr:histone deacetylase family protein [Desulfobacteraceae bacterium]
MFRIRKILDSVSNANKYAINQVLEIIKKQFPTTRVDDLLKLPLQLVDPLKYQYRSILFSAEDHLGRVKGFAMLLHISDIGVTYLELISTAPLKTGKGLGTILYERIREESINLKAKGLFFESSIDDERVCDPEILLQNKKRMVFYERFGALPIINNIFDSPVKPGDKDLYYLMYDPLNNTVPLDLDLTKQVARAVLERKYKKIIDPLQIEKIVNSFCDNPAVLRKPIYKAKPFSPKVQSKPLIGLLVNENHVIHHVAEKGYVESPIRISQILKEISKTGMFKRLKPRKTPFSLLKKIHDPEYLNFLKNVCKNLPEGKSIYPSVFPGRNRFSSSRDIEVQIGCFCTDTMTPLNKNAYLAAIGAVDCAVTAAEILLEDFRLSYALVRPPGHHAEWNKFGGFCYFNSTAAASEYLSDYGKVAVIDIDFHHGNGTQDIFYERSDVLTCSIHGDPACEYPYFSGFAKETGSKEGKGFNINIPLPKNCTAEKFHEALEKIIRKVKNFKPDFIVVALGLDTAKSDPTGSWNLLSKDFETTGKMIGRINLPTLIVQEGGYRTRTLGINARKFFEGIYISSEKN